MKKHSVLALVLAASAVPARAFEVEEPRLRVQGETTTLEGRIVGAAPGPVLLSIQYGVAPAGARRGPAPGPGMQDPGWMGPGAAPGTTAPAGGGSPDTIEATLPGADRAVLRRDFDSRMVEQRQLPPFLSVPFSLDVWKGSTLIQLRYNSFREGAAPGDMEDAFSGPVVAVLASRAGLGLAQTPLGKLVGELLGRREPLARTGDMRLGELRIKVDGAPLRGLRIETGTSPRAVLRTQPGKVELEARVVRDTRLAYADRLEAGPLEPMADHWITLECGPDGKRLAEAATGPDGWARVAFEARGAERIALMYHPEQGKTWTGGNVGLYWRWGRPEEAWLDRGAPPVPGADPKADAAARRKAIVESLLYCWSPDDGAFKDPTGSSGLCNEYLVAEVLAPALARLGPGFGEPKGAVGGSLAALRARLSWCEEEVAKYGSADTLMAELGTLPGSVPFARLEGVLSKADYAFQQIPDHWTRDAAWAGLVASRWLEGPAAKADPAGRAAGQRLLETLRAKARAEARPFAARYLGKGGEPQVYAVENDWLAHLVLGSAFARAGGAFEAERKEQLKRFVSAFGAADPGAAPLAQQALAARLARFLVEKKKATGLKPALARLEALVLAAWDAGAATMGGCDRLAVLRGLEAEQ